MFSQECCYIYIPSLLLYSKFTCTLVNIVASCFDMESVHVVTITVYARFCDVVCDGPIWELWCIYVICVDYECRNKMI